MESEGATEGTSPVSGLLPLASDSQQPYVSELLSFTLDRLHKVPSSSLHPSSSMLNFCAFHEQSVLYYALLRSCFSISGLHLCPT